MKALLMFLLAFAAFLVVRFVMKRVEEIRSDSFTDKPEQNNDQPAESMVACKECGLRLPKSEAIMLSPSEDHTFFCSQSHKQQYQSSHPEEDA